MKNKHEIQNAAEIAPLLASIRLGLHAVRIARTRSLPDAEFTTARNAYLATFKPTRSRRTKPKKD